MADDYDQWLAEHGGALPDPARVMSGKGSWRITLQGGGITMFECWDMDDTGKVLAYFSAGAPPKEGGVPAQTG